LPVESCCRATLAAGSSARLEFLQAEGRYRLLSLQ